MVKYEYKELDINTLLPNPLRSKNQPTKDSILKLADSIRQYGLFTPLLVGDTSAGYQIIAGERRFRAAKIAGLSKIPAMVIKASSLELMILFWEENMHHESMNLIEQAKLVKQLLSREGITKKIVSSRLAISQEYIDLLLELLELPSGVQDKYLNGEITDDELTQAINDGDIVSLLH